MKKWMALGGTLGMAVLAIAGCGGQRAQQQTVTIKGSDTMVILGQRWGED